MSVDSHADLLLRQLGAATLIDDLMPLLVNAGWSVGVNVGDKTRSLLANKAAGRLYVPGGRDGKWHTQIAQVGRADTTPASVRNLLPDYDERPVWRVELDQSVPVDLVLTVAEHAAGEIGGVLVAR